jgi:hypothetical protein
MTSATILPKIFLCSHLSTETLNRWSMLIVRKEIAAYAGACERLLKLDFPLNAFEQRVLSFYLAELSRQIPQEHIEDKLQTLP